MKRLLRFWPALLIAIILPLAGCDVAPDASFTSPTNQATLEGTVTLSVNATGTPAPSVQFQVDGQNIGTSVAAPPYQITWDSTVLPNSSPTPNGQHTLTALSSNIVGNKTTTISVNVQNPPVPASVHVLGDSITIQAFYGHGYGVGAPGDLMVTAGLGWRVQEVQPDATAQAALRRPEIQLVALGTNDSGVVFGGDGWTTADLDRTTTLLNTPHRRACKVLVTPGYGPGVNPAQAVQIDEAVTDMVALDQSRIDVVSVSWQDVINANPGIIDPDGIHLASPQTNEMQDFALESANKVAVVTPQAAGLRAQLYWQGVSACQAEMVAHPEYFALAA